WSAAIATVLLERGVVTTDELDAELDGDSVEGAGAGAGAGTGAGAGFKVGDVVRVRAEDSRLRWRRPHIRCPGYIFGQVGVVVEKVGLFPDPFLLAFRGTGPPQPLYRVSFDLQAMWGSTSAPGSAPAPASTSAPAPASATPVPRLSGGDRLLADIYGGWLELYTGPTASAADTAPTAPTATAPTASAEHTEHTHTEHTHTEHTHGSAGGVKRQRTESSDHDHGHDNAYDHGHGHGHVNEQGEEQGHGVEQEHGHGEGQGQGQGQGNEGKEGKEGNEGDGGVEGHTQVHDHDHGHTHEGRYQVECVAVAREGETQPGQVVGAALIRLLTRKGVLVPGELQKVVSALETSDKKLLGADLVVRAWLDGGFRERLLRD
ncbi:electron transport accessory protein-like domain-containing protein, partial [Ochromonadaceae sp. CCMP2298]